MSDPISDMLTVIRNALRAGHKQASVRYSNIKRDILNVLKEEGYIEDYHIQEDGNLKLIHINLKYYEGKPAIEVIARISKQSRRIYVSHHAIPSPYNGLGSVIVSTSRGVMTGKAAKSKKVGGEVLCSVF
jgi:small subunit ribosomal protein S8